MTRQSTYNKIMTRMTLLPFCLLVLITNFSHAQTEKRVQPNPDMELQQFVNRAIPFLDSSQLQQRQEAEKALISRGPAILDLLPNDLEPYSSEIQTRIERVRQQLYVIVAKQTSSGSRFSLSGSYRLSEVIEELEKQTGNIITTSRALATTTELDLKDVPFYLAFDKLLDQSGLDIEPYFAPHPNQVLIKPKLDGIAPRSEHAHYTGPFRIAATNVTLTRNLRIPNAKQCALTLQVAWEPRVRPLYLTMPASQLKATDDSGASLTILIDGEKTLNVEGTAPLVEVELPFTLPAPSARHIDSVTGTISAMVPGRKEHFAFSNLQAADSFPKQQRRAGVTITVRSVRQTDQQTMVEVELHYKDVGNAFESHRGWTNRNAAYLTSKEERLATKPRRETIVQKKQSVTYRYSFDTTEELNSLSFHYHTPALLIQKDVEFKLNEIPLP